MKLREEGIVGMRAIVSPQSIFFLFSLRLKRPAAIRATGTSEGNRGSSCILGGPISKGGEGGGIMGVHTLNCSQAKF